MSAPVPFRPPGIRAVNGIGRGLARLGIQPSLDPDHLIDGARKQAGLSDFGSEDFRVGLTRVCESLEGEARLNTIGRITARSTIGGRLTTRLRVVQWRKDHPEIDQEKIERPIFVLGLPRTGTTVLYGLLASNPALRSPTSWEMDQPVPPPVPGAAAYDPRVAAFDKTVAGLDRIAPEVQHIHPVAALLPQECIAIHTMECRSYEFVVTFPVPSYFDWLREDGIRQSYDYQKWFLQHMQSGYGGDHWLLKSPAHLMWPDQLLEVFPDALFIQTHRDPAKVLGSVSSL